VSIAVEIPGRGRLALDHLLLDVNGTLTDRGALLPGVADRLGALRATLEVRLLSADTFGTLEGLAAQLGVAHERVETGADKLAVVERLGPAAVALVGNGANDAAALEAAALGIAVVGPEGAAAAALAACDVVCPSIAVALDLLADSRALVATLRA
jgi:P-type E1-E2 ATPase